MLTLTMRVKGLSELQTVWLLFYNSNHSSRVNTETQNLSSSDFKELFSSPVGTKFLTDLRSFTEKQTHHPHQQKISKPDFPLCLNRQTLGLHHVFHGDLQMVSA